MFSVKVFLFSTSPTYTLRGTFCTAALFHLFNKYICVRISRTLTHTATYISREILVMATEYVDCKRRYAIKCDQHKFAAQSHILSVL